MLLPDLNLDVLLHINAFLVLSETSQLTRTCRSLHDVLVHVLLQGPITLYRDRIISLRRFMHQGSRRGYEPDDTPRDMFPFLRTLIIVPGSTTGSPSPSESAQALNDILHRSRDLISLTVLNVSMTFPPQQLRMAFAASLPALEALILCGITADYRDALADVVSPHLRTVQLSSSLDSDVDLMPLLQYHRLMITTLSLSSAALGDLEMPLPSVRELRVISFSPKNDETGWAAPLVHLFPNVEHVSLRMLYMSDGFTLWALDPCYGHNIADTWRARAKAWELQHGTWKNGLRYLRVHSIMSLYCLGLSCHVSCLDLIIAELSLHMANVALADVRPRCIWLPLAFSDMPDNTELPALMRVVASTRSVTHLRAEIWNLKDCGGNDFVVSFTFHKTRPCSLRSYRAH
ncbi:uncharacterized protein TRAVEDRAFT_48608 [Trametes versicolor FP-101664 SS1]|uniref:uncharacterized protein n=1 Tax=Trametes versicolor (strain FP-101664) TaxID=717944 RepID=UPI0004621CCF|nr:uncharacterized protein TRAVEDRAFT_48608 [Trametes versicolor FP-101664 SS1]EIW57573.1 hypothetical protein TRAVEDRAFT_48608 [Trametes versicolor FP-101664 SS1]